MDCPTSKVVLVALMLIGAVKGRGGGVVVSEGNADSAEVPFSLRNTAGEKLDGSKPYVLHFADPF